MKIRVTRECIKKGKKRNYRFCPIALAIKKAGFKSVFVDLTSVRIQGITFNLSNTVQNFIMDFDCEQNVKPFTFELKGLKKP